MEWLLYTSVHHHHTEHATIAWSDCYIQTYIIDIIKPLFPFKCNALAHRACCNSLAWSDCARIYKCTSPTSYRACYNSTKRLLYSIYKCTSHRACYNSTEWLRYNYKRVHHQHHTEHATIARSDCSIQAYITNSVKPFFPFIRKRYMESWEPPHSTEADHEKTESLNFE